MSSAAPPDIVKTLLAHHIPLADIVRFGLMLLGPQNRLFASLWPLPESLVNTPLFHYFCYISLFFHLYTAFK